MRFLATLLLYLTTNIFAADLISQPVGTYIFTKNYELTGCAEFEDTHGPIAQCKRLETKHFTKNDEIKVDEFFFDDKTNTFGAKYVHLGQFRRIPLDIIKLKPKIK